MIFQNFDCKNVDSIAYSLIYTNFSDCSSRYALRTQQFHCYSECVYIYIYICTWTPKSKKNAKSENYIWNCEKRQCWLTSFEWFSVYLAAILSLFSSTVSKDQGDTYQLFFIYLDTLFSGIVYVLIKKTAYNKNYWNWSHMPAFQRQSHPYVFTLQCILKNVLHIMKICCFQMRLYTAQAMKKYLWRSWT